MTRSKIRTILIVTLLLCAIVATISLKEILLSYQETADTQREIGVKHYDLTHRNKSYKVVEIDLTKETLSVRRTDSGESPYKNFASLISDLDASGEQVKFATNGGIFDTKIQPSGLYIEDGRVKYPLNLNEGEGNFFLKPNGVFSLHDGSASIVDTEEYEATGKLIDVAVQSGPLLVKDGVIHPAFNEDSKNLFIRSGAGVQSPSRIFFVLSNEPVNFYAFAELFRTELDCANALFLDGTISQFYIQDGDLPYDREYGSYFVVTTK